MKVTNATILALAGTLAARAAVAGPAGCAAADTLADSHRVAAPGVELAWRPVPAPIAVGRPFAVEIVVCASGDPAPAIDGVRVDAWMPAHRHGMNYRPTVSGSPGGPMRAEGLLLHMPGRWQLVFEMRVGDRPVRLTDDLTIR